MAAMDVADSLSPSGGMQCEDKEEVLPTDVETPSSLIVSSETACGLKQSRLLFPPSTSSPPTPSSHKDTPTDTPIEQLGGVPSNGSPPQSTTTPSDAVTQTMEVEEAGDVSRGQVTGDPSTPVTVFATLTQTQTKVKKTKSEREALRLERERLRAVTQALREEEKVKKEAARLRKELEKKARRERREQEERARQEKKEAREREKREKQERRETERRARGEEERKKKEEKRKAELEKQQCVEQKIRKQHKEQELFTSFFSKLPKSEAQTNGNSENEKKGVVFDVSVLDEMIRSQTLPTSSYLVKCQSRRLRTNRPHPLESDDVIIMSSPNAQPRPRMKLLQFHSNVRPAYFGSWRKRSRVISGRAPFRMDTSVLDYEFDSDDEWEEEEPGESVSSASEGEESGGEDSGEEGEEDGFFVPHGYLSEDEGERSESEEGPQMDKMKAKAKAWEAEFQRTCQPKKPVCIGCIWIEGGGGEGGGGGGEVRDKDKDFLSQFSALVLTDAPVRVEPTTPVTLTPPEPQNGSSVADNLRRPVPEEAMPDLIRLVHQSTAGLVKLIKTFQTHWSTVIQGRVAKELAGPAAGGEEPGEEEQGMARPTMDIHSPSVTSGVSPSPQVREGEGEKQSGISKRQLEKKIQQIAVKEVRHPSTRPRWYVHDQILDKYKMDAAQIVPLLPPTPKSTGGSADKSSSPEAPVSTPVNKKGTKRRAAGSTPTLFEVIAKSPQTTSSATTPAQKRLKLAPSPVGTVGKPSEPPPKKRIKLESLMLIPPHSTGPGSNSGAIDSPIIVIDDSSADNKSSVQPTDNSNPSTHIASRNGQSQLSNKCPPPLPTTHPTDDVTAVPANKGSTKCLQEVTNSQTTAGGIANSSEEGGDKNRENRPHVDWQKLLSTNSSNSNKVTIIADIH